MTTAIPAELAKQDAPTDPPSESGQVSATARA